MLFWPVLGCPGPRKLKFYPSDLTTGSSVRGPERALREALELRIGGWFHFVRRGDSGRSSKPGAHLAIGSGALCVICPVA